MKTIVKYLIVTALVSYGLLASGQSQNSSIEQSLFPFVLPWDDSTQTITDVSYLLDKPAGKSGYVQVGKDGHFYVGGKRIRFFGVNMSFAGGMPQKEHSGGVAGRLAKFGVNVVRFHHMDTGAWPSGIRDPKSRQTGELSSEALDRLDYFVNELKKRGIYANMNLLVGRPFNSADGLPAEIEKLDWKDRHIIGFFNDKHLELQKDYARKLLTHKNPYTGFSYNEEPAVAFVEINNEQGLIHSYLGGEVDRLPEVFLNELKNKWNLWLKRKYVSTSKLRSAWQVGEQPLGNEMLKNVAFSDGLNNWIVEQHSPAKAIFIITNDLPTELAQRAQNLKSVRIQVMQPGSESWHIQFNQGGLKMEAGNAYIVKFWAKARQARQIAVNVSQAHKPWENLGLYANVSLKTNWAEYAYTFIATKTDDRSRITFSSFGASGDWVQFASISLKPGGIIGLNAGENLENSTINYFSKATIGSRTKTAQMDWMRFLYETENNYWQSMYNYLKRDLKVRALITGTIAGCAPINMMAKMDWVDTHNYWQHPRFPGRPWDPVNWIVENRSMVNERGGTLPGLSLKRVYGKPIACTEYNHPAPNTYCSEGFLLLAAYASLQDWDAIYAYSYAHNRPDGWDTRKMEGFFDIDQHPTKMATLVAASTMFLRGDIKPAIQIVAASLPVDWEIDLLRNASAWRLVDGGTSGIQPELSLIHKVGVVMEGAKIPSGALTPDKVKINTSKFISDTGELVWDVSTPKRGVVTLNTARAKGVIGFGGGKEFELGEFTLIPGEGMQNGWSAITLIQVGEKRSSPQRWLLTATGYAQNTGVQWKNPEKSSVGRDWGSAPSLVEGVPARISVQNPKAKIQVWALDEKGQRKSSLPVISAQDGKQYFEIGQKYQTLWYEIGLQ